MATEWNVARHGERCAACGRGFEPEEAFSAVLYPSDDGGFARRDYCETCPPAAELVAIGQWRAHRPPATPKPRPLDREALLEFLSRLGAAKSPEQVQFRFVLALMLWRKKVLQFVETTTDQHEREVWRFRVPREQTEQRVVRPDLDEERIDQLSEQLDRLLASGQMMMDADSVAAEADSGSAEADSINAEADADSINAEADADSINAAAGAVAVGAATDAVASAAGIGGRDDAGDD